MKTRSLLPLAALAVVVSGAACAVDSAPDPLGVSPPGKGALVKFDTTHRPLPEIPVPNDVATFADPTSRTGRRINVSLVAPTEMEGIIRQAFTDMEGWGTSQPISVAFQKPVGVDPNEAAIDLADFASRMTGDEHDLSNDPIYVVNLRTGVPMFMDAGGGYYPVTLRDPHKYFPHDPKAGESNLLFETVEEGAGLTQADYRPELDKDFDGVLDHPNTLGKGGIFGVDNLLTWYERETDTLILRPVLPLDEKTEYAVVLTDRMRSGNGAPVKSPFAGVHHPAQRRGAERLKEVLNDGRLASYYGDIAGTGLSHVAFMWTFTTQPTFEDMKLLRDGLYGKGPFARFKDEFPPDAQAFPAGGVSSDPAESPGWQTSTAACKERAKAPYVLKLQDPDVKKAFHDMLADVFNLSPGELKSTEAQFQWIDHVVIGTFKSPFLLGDPASRDENTRFHVSFVNGEGDVRSDTVSFFMVVPKETPGHKQPFPIGMLGHGVTGNASEALFYGGDYARQGIALVGVNMPEHGATLSDGERLLARSKLTETCLVPFLKAYESGRAHDLNGDGKPDSGWFWWTTHIPHTRDNVRQGLLDTFQAVRVFRNFDGQRRSTQDYNGDGTPDLAGDFDGNGVPDVGGSQPFYTTGESLGSIMADIQGGAEPQIIATSSAGGGAGSLALDVAFRSYGVVEAVTGQMLTPIVFSVPATERQGAPQKNAHDMGSRCAKDQRSVRLLVNEGDDMHELEVACLKPEELGEKMTVVVTNLKNKEVRCARTGVEGRFRVNVPSTKGDRLDVQVYTAPDVVASYKGCKVKSGAPVGRRINTFEQQALWYLPVADPDKSQCIGEAGCAQFRDEFYTVGTPLVAPNDGFGLQRQTPEVRRLRDLAQAAFDPADPINYAPYFMARPFTDENGQIVPKRALLATNTVGDAFVAISGGISFARAAGAVPFLPPSALTRYPDYANWVTPEALYRELGGKTPMQVLIDTGVVEGIARLGKTKAGPGCKQNFRGVDGVTCKSERTIDKLRCENALSDPDWVSEGQQRFDQPHPKAPLRLARLADGAIRDSTELAAAWEPRLRGVPFSPDASAWSASGRVVGMFNNYIEPQGTHTWDTPDYCRAWDHATYGNALIARFFASGGKDVYYLSHPSSHLCLEKGTCEFLPQ